MMAFQLGHSFRPVNRRAITARESDAIVAALRADPNAIEEIATRFNRSPGTIDKIRERHGIGRKRLPYGSLRG